eukprot:scaffold127866_cov23-Prasinocladus_malaysianus.AAC.1
MTSRACRKHTDCIEVVANGMSDFFIERFDNSSLGSLHGSASRYSSNAAPPACCCLSFPVL